MTPEVRLAWWFVGLTTLGLALLTLAALAHRNDTRKEQQQ